MIKRIKLNPETEIKMLYDQLDVKESLIKNYMAEIEIQRQQLAIAVEALNWYDGLEKMLIGWEIATGQKKGTAKQALEQIEEFDK